MGITNVPNSNGLVTTALRRTQRQTPTIVRNSWPIQRIRLFYILKIKYFQNFCHEKITQIIIQFPKIEDIHPFYADILNVLYDRDHYKLALGKLNNSRKLITKISQDYVNLLKYSDTLYRCKQLKKAAFGRICTIGKKIMSALIFLEQVRKHMLRISNIDPNTKTILICGYPNVGKSSFMNKLTIANVEVQPYSFTTKSLFIGHMDYKHYRWQVIDMPGILDRSLEERNIIEMQSITSLAHLKASVLYIFDISERCGYSLQQQANLYHSIKPLFNKKPIIIVCNKIDLMAYDSLLTKDKDLIRAICLENKNRIPTSTHNSPNNFICVSTLTEEGLVEAKQLACDSLLDPLVDLTSKDHKMTTIRVQTKKESEHHIKIPENSATTNEKKILFIKLSEVSKTNQKKKTNLFRHNLIPEIWNGHNIADFNNKKIDIKTSMLEADEKKISNEWQFYLEEHRSTITTRLKKRSRRTCAKIKAYNTNIATENENY